MAPDQVVVGLALAVLAACEAERAAQSGSSREQEAAESATSTSPPVSPSAPAVEEGTVVRTCESSVEGDLGPGWRNQAVTVGPVAFVGLRAYEDIGARALRPRHGRLRSQKVLVVVDGSRPATLRLGRGAVAKVSLLYDEESFRDLNRYRVKEGHDAVRFEPCASEPGTQFNGGFIVAGPRCVPLSVRIGDASPRRLAVPFGVGAC